MGRHRKAVPKRNKGKATVKRRHKVVTVAGLDSCHHCLDTKQFLKKNKVPFKFLDINKRNGAKLADSVHAQHVPVIQVCNGSSKKPSCSTTEGFNPRWLKRHLKL